MKNFCFVPVFLLLFFNFGHAQVYKDPNAPIEKRIDDLVSRMTPAGKG